MAKIYPQTSISPCSSSNLERETYTIWLKSLVVNGNGCTVYNSNGQIIYLVDNYDNKSSDEVCLMDLQGKVLCSILRKKFQLLGCWNGYKNDGPKMKNDKPWFRVKKRISKSKSSSYQAILRLNDAQNIIYTIEEDHTNKQSFKIVDNEQRIVAEVNPKLSSGVVLGNDVLSILIEPNVDHSLIISLITFYGLINKKR